MIPKFKEIDLSKTTEKGGNGLKVGPHYLCLYNNRLYIGNFSKEWYGLNFNGIYDCGCEYDPPLENKSLWQKIWLIKNYDEIIKGNK